MAWSKADVPDAERALLAADLPCLIGRNWSRTATGLKWTAAGGHAGADISATNYDAAFGADDFDHNPTKPNAAGTTLYFNLLLSGVDALDAFALLNHNLNGKQLDLQIADDATFATRLATILTVAPASNKRLVSYVLKEAGDTYAQRFAGVTYARLKLTGASWTPQHGEVVLGRRRQLEKGLLLPFAPKNYFGALNRSRSEAGVVTDVVSAKGGRRLQGVYHTNDSAQISSFESFWETDIDFGTLAWLWTRLPYSAPSDSQWMKFDDPNLVDGSQFTTDRRYEIAATELGPNYLALGV